MCLLFLRLQMWLVSAGALVPLQDLIVSQALDKD
jgi:hypothetical protein